MYRPQQKLINLPIPNGFYTGSNGFETIAYVAIDKNSAIADFILFDKFPRELFSDTLVLDEKTNDFFGRFCKLHQINYKIHLTTIDTLRIFGRTINIEISLNEKYYTEVIDEYKNLATWSKFEYWCFTNPEYTSDILTDLKFLKSKYTISSKISTFKYKDFLEELKKIKRETDSLDLKKQ